MSRRSEALIVTLVEQEGLTDVLHAIVETCYQKASWHGRLKPPLPEQIDAWQHAGHQLSIIEEVARRYKI